LDKVLKFLFIIALVFIVSLFIPKDITLNSMIMKDHATLNATTPQAYAKNTKKLAPELVDYLKKSNKYGTYYNQNKKFAIYFTGMNCPYGEAFANAMSAIVNDPSYKDSYNFYAMDANQTSAQFNSNEEAKNDVDFSNLCNAFCIVNPSKNELYYLDGVGEEDAANIKTTFDNLKAW